VFVTSQGYRYAQFQRALKTGNVFLAMNAARAGAGLSRVPLP